MNPSGQAVEPPEGHTRPLLAGLAAPGSGQDHQILAGDCDAPEGSRFDAKARRLELQDAQAVPQRRGESLAGGAPDRQTRE